MEAHACKHFQTGFCKFGNRCRKHHIKEICKNENCKSKSCNMRHPKPCKYYKVHQSCKFGDLCCYSHSIPTKQYDIAILVAKVNQMESTIKSMSEQIKLLEEEVDSHKNEQFSCEFCEYQASSTTVLKRHVTTKHRKEKPSTTEKVRTSSINDSLNISIPIEERTEDTFISSPLHVEEIDTPAISQFKCELCKFESPSSHELQGHISFFHNPSLPHTSKWEQNKCGICSKVFNNTVHFKNHMIELHSFSLTDICMHCTESSEVGLYLAMPHQAIFLSCKKCELLLAAGVIM